MNYPSERGVRGAPDPRVAMTKKVGGDDRARSAALVENPGVVERNAQDDVRDRGVQLRLVTLLENPQVGTTDIRVEAVAGHLIADADQGVIRRETRGHKTRISRELPEVGGKNAPGMAD
jgi:hypothetical protein